MADTKAIDLTEDSSPTLDDIVYLVNDPGGTPLDRKATLASILALATGGYPTALTAGTITGFARINNHDNHVAIATGRLT